MKSLPTGRLEREFAVGAYSDVRDQSLFNGIPRTVLMVEPAPASFDGRALNQRRAGISGEIGVQGANWPLGFRPI